MPSMLERVHSIDHPADSYLEQPNRDRQAGSKGSKGIVGTRRVVVIPGHIAHKHCRPQRNTGFLSLRCRPEDPIWDLRDILAIPQEYVVSNTYEIVRLFEYFATGLKIPNGPFST